MKSINSYPICLDCKYLIQINSISIYNKKQLSINYTCKCKQSNRTIPVSSYYKGLHFYEGIYRQKCNCLAQIAKYFCLNCSISLCSKCIVNHSKEHLISNYNFNNYGSNKCLSHNESLSLFCHSCKQLLCKKCEMFHISHTLYSVKDYYSLLIEHFEKEEYLQIISQKLNSNKTLINQFMLLYQLYLKILKDTQNYPNPLLLISSNNIENIKSNNYSLYYVPHPYVHNNRIFSTTVDILEINDSFFNMKNQLNGHQTIINIFQLENKTILLFMGYLFRLERKDKRFPLLQKKFDDFNIIEESFPTKIPINGKKNIDTNKNFDSYDNDYFTFYDDDQNVFIYCSILYNDNMSSILSYHLFKRRQNLFSFKNNIIAYSNDFRILFFDFSNKQHEIVRYVYNPIYIIYYSVILSLDTMLIVHDKLSIVYLHQNKAELFSSLQDFVNQMESIDNNHILVMLNYSFLIINITTKEKLFLASPVKDKKREKLTFCKIWKNFILGVYECQNINHFLIYDMNKEYQLIYRKEFNCYITNFLFVENNLVLIDIDKKQFSNFDIESKEITNAFIGISDNDNTYNIVHLEDNYYLFINYLNGVTLYKI